jgi:CBS domain-containing protein
MEEYVKGPAPERWQWTKNYSQFPKWHWNKNCTHYPHKVIQRRSTRPTSDLCDECLKLEKREQFRRELSCHKEVKEIMSPNVVTITPEALLSEAAQIMGAKHIGSLVVTNYNMPVGIVTERDLLSKVLALGKDLKEVKIEAIMSYPLITIEPEAKIKEAAQMMAQKKSRLVVFECGKYVGIVTKSDLIKSLPEVPETKVKVDNFMTKPVETADEKTPIESVAKTMGEKHIGSIIVTSKGEPFGIFTERDLFNAFCIKGKPLIAEVGEDASSPLITAPVGTSVHQAAVTMAMKHIRRLPVTRNGKIVGIVTARDLFEAYAK